ncbi:MAG: ABC transporter permease subunit [Chloroflexota bacterium]
MVQNREYVYGLLLALMLIVVIGFGQEAFTATSEPLIPIGEAVVVSLDWLVDNYRSFFQTLKQPFTVVLNGIETTLKATSPLLLLIVIGLGTWQIGGLRVATLVVGCFFVTGAIGAWTAAMTTLAIIATCVIFCSLVGIPLGILSARSDQFEGLLRPVLDLMQTIPSFVYLVPVVMLFGIGNVPGVIVTIIYALPPVIRLTSLGIRQVQADMVEASHAFGASEFQTLLKIQMPQAMPTIMAGVNQMIMMSLSMTVVASMISVTGLGQMVLRGIGRLDMNIATVGGLGIVLLAVAVDRFSQSFGITDRERGHAKWYQHGPVGLVYMLATRRSA